MMKQFLIALQFLTILPIKIKSEMKKRDFGKSLLYFPIVGILIGLLLSITAFLFGFLPDLVTGVLILIVSILITGGIHLDGFADTCDGFYGSRSKDEILKIMRDSRVGVMGAVGVVSILLLKFSLIVSMPQYMLWKSLIAMAIFARWTQVLACYTSNYARKEGRAKYFIEYASKKEFLTGAFFTIVLFILLIGLKGIIVFIIALLPMFLLTNYIKKRIDGMTGDTIGAMNEIAETVVLLLMLIQ